MSEKSMTFWEHLDEFRGVLFRVIGVALVAAIVAFGCSEWIFKLLLAPSEDNFILYRGFAWLGHQLGMTSLVPEPFHVQLISTELTSQFMVSMSVAFYTAVVVIAPYILYELFKYISPALYKNERKYSGRVVVYSYFLFMIGVLLNYFIIFPLSYRFLATYQVSERVISTITINSYVDTLLMLTLMMGIVFEIPVLSWMLAKLGVLNAGFMRMYRRHALVVILIVAAIITPTTDAITLLIVALPIYLLYEFSIYIVKREEKKIVNTAPETPEEEWENNPYEYKKQ